MSRFKKERSIRSRTQTLKHIKSVSGLQMVARTKGQTRIVVSFLDREGRLIVKGNFDSRDWEDFIR